MINWRKKDDCLQLAADTVMAAKATGKMRFWANMAMDGNYAVYSNFSRSAKLSSIEMD